MGRSSIDDRIHGSWQKLLESHMLLKGRSSDLSLSKEETFNVAKDIPFLTELIEGQQNKQELEMELKRLVMKYYWHGFYNGAENGIIQNHSSNVEEPSNKNSKES